MSDAICFDTYFSCKLPRPFSPGNRIEPRVFPNTLSGEKFFVFSPTPPTSVKYHWGERAFGSYYFSLKLQQRIFTEFLSFYEMATFRKLIRQRCQDFGGKDF